VASRIEIPLDPLGAPKSGPATMLRIMDGKIHVWIFNTYWVIPPLHAVIAGILVLALVVSLFKIIQLLVSK
jgi:hypothetical protein